jgi:hypothetical protein
MDGQNKKYIDDEIRDILKEYDPSKLLDIKEQAKKLGYNSVMEYLLKAHELYKVLVEENKKGRLFFVLSQKHHPIKKESEKATIELTEEDKILKINMPGLLEHMLNGNSNK